MRYDVLIESLVLIVVVPWGVGELCRALSRRR